MSDYDVSLEDGSKPFGGFWRRFLAALIDSIILFVPIWLLMSMAGVSMFALSGMESQGYADDPSAMAAAMGESLLVMGFISGAIYILYKVGFESSALQATPGKMALGIKVTDSAGEQLSPVTALLRSWPAWAPSAFMVLDGALGTFGMMSNAMALAAMLSGLVIAFTARKQGVHDMMVGALVVKKAARFSGVASAA